MSKRISIILALVVVSIICAFIITELNKPAKVLEKDEEVAQMQDDPRLKVIKTNPDPLEEATLLPVQSIEITFNKEIPKSEFKHIFTPEIKNYEIEALGGGDATRGTTIKINFKEPLELGAGYTLMIQNTTRTNDNVTLDKEYIYHFKTIQYKGV